MPTAFRSAWMDCAHSVNGERLRTTMLTVRLDTPACFQEFFRLLWIVLVVHIVLAVQSLCIPLNTRRQDLIGHLRTPVVQLHEVVLVDGVLDGLTDEFVVERRNLRVETEVEDTHQRLLLNERLILRIKLLHFRKDCAGMS